MCVSAPRSRAWQTCFFFRRNVTFSVFLRCVDLRSSSTHTQSPYTKSEKVITQRMPDRPSNGPFFPKQFPSLPPGPDTPPTPTRASQTFAMQATPPDLKRPASFKRMLTKPILNRVNRRTVAVQRRCVGLRLRKGPIFALIIPPTDRVGADDDAGSYADAMVRCDATRVHGQ